MFDHIEVPTSTQHHIRFIEDEARKRVAKANHPRQRQLRTLAQNWGMQLLFPFKKARATVFSEYGSYPMEGSVLLTVYLKPTQHFRDVSPVLEYFMENGWDVDYSTDYPKDLNRDFVLQPIREGLPQVRVHVYADEHSETCRRVEVGFETEEVRRSTYKMVCE